MAQQGASPSIGKSRVIYSWKVKNFSQKKGRIQTKDFPVHTKLPYRWKLSLNDDLGYSKDGIELGLSFTANHSSPIHAVRCPADVVIILARRTGIHLEVFTFAKEYSLVEDKTSIFKLNKEKLMSGVRGDGDELEVFCEITAFPNQIPSEIKSRFTSSRFSCLRDFNSLWLNPQHSDVTLNSSDGIELKAHRLILSARSPVFEAMFANDVSENKDGQIVIKEFDARTLRKFLSFLYSGTLPEEGMTPADRMNLLDAAHKYDIKSLEHLMEECLIHDINVANAIDILYRSYLYNCQKLKDPVINFVCSPAAKLLLNSAQWNAMVMKYPHILKDCFQHIMQFVPYKFDLISE